MQIGRGKQRTLSDFSKDLHWFFWHGPALALMGEQEGTWLSGLCWGVAEGLLRWVTLSRTLPPHAVFLIVLGDANCPAHHVLVCFSETPTERRSYLDAHGVSSREELFRYWEQEEGLEDPFLAPYDEHLLLDVGIGRDARLSLRLAEGLLEAFGPFSPAWLEGKVSFAEAQ